jgi:2-methylcitrate dehydratase PrpD
MESDDHKHFLDDLGTKHQVMDLYFKPYTCCRWGHPAIDACLEIMNGYNLTPEDIEKATVYTFEKATMLSKIVPKEVDEAQYNIAYPVAAALIYGDFGWAQVRKESLGDPAVVEMMKKLHFEIDPEFDRQFPAKRYCRAEIVTKDGRTLVSSDCEPRGEAHENISVDWLADKFRRITGPVLTSEGQEKILAMICGEENVDVRAIVDEVNKKEYWKDI